jgi:hypothetical protein
MLDRRTFLLSTVAVAGCSGVTPGPGPSPTPIVPPQVLDDVTLVLSSIQNVLPLLGSFVSPQLSATINGYLAQAQQLVSEIGSVTSTGTLQSKVQAFVQIIRQVLSALQTAGVQIPSGVSVILVAAQILLPIILAAVGLVSAQAPRSAMSPEQARATLRAAARR